MYFNNLVKQRLQSAVSASTKERIFCLGDPALHLAPALVSLPHAKNFLSQCGQAFKKQALTVLSWFEF